MVAMATITPERIAAGRHRRRRATVIVGPKVPGDRLADALAGRWGPGSPASVHVVAIDGSRPLWSTWAEWDLCLVGGVWDLYEDSWRCQQRTRLERLADLERGLNPVAPSATFETFVGPLRAALLQAPARWPGSSLVIAGPWRRLPWRRRPWPGEIELLSL
ncbi:MAG: hypothetical protein R2761_30985 [Acidimicrobiales bacterium]